MSLIIDTYNNKNARIATAWELLRKYYRTQLSHLAFIFADYCFEVASEMVNDTTDFEGDHIRFNCSREYIYDYLQIKSSTFRTKNKVTGLCPRQELEQIGFVFEQGNSITKKKGNVLIPMFSQIELDDNKIVIDNITEHKFGREKTIQRLNILAEKARGLGRLTQPHEIDFNVATINNYTLNKTDSDELKEQKLRKQYFILLHKKGFNPVQNKEMNYASVNQIFKQVITNQYHEAFQKAIQYVLKDGQLTGYDEINGALRSRTDKVIEHMLAPKMTKQEIFNAKREKAINEMKLNIKDKLATMKSLDEKLNYLYAEKEKAEIFAINHENDYEYFDYVMGSISRLDKDFRNNKINLNIEEDQAVNEFETNYYEDSIEELMFG